MLLSINMASERAHGIVLTSIPSVGLCVGLSVCPESVLWLNSQVDPDVVLGGEWGQWRDECIRGGPHAPRGKRDFMQSHTSDPS